MNRGLAAAVALTCLAAPAVHAQGTPPSDADGAGRLIGRVLYQDQAVGVPYATVTLMPTGGSRFADSSGAFAFVRLAPGAYHVRARQIGYTPSDTTVQVNAAPAVTSLTMRLRRVVRLQRVTVRAQGSKECVRPGVPDSTIDPELAMLFAQVRENVLRLKILMIDYPFRYHRVDEFIERGGGSADRLTQVDTLNLDSWTEPGYEPGQVVVNGLDPHGRPSQFMHLVQFQDLGDKSFEETHCFRLAERDRSDDGSLVRVDFRPAVSLRTPDIEGSVYLDPERLIVRHAVFHLTRPGLASPPIHDWTYSSSFREVVPLVPVVSGFHSVVQAGRPGTMVEDGRVLDYSFIREAPVDPTVHDTLAGASTAHVSVGQVTFAPSADRPCTPPPPQLIVEALTGTLLAPSERNAAATPWLLTARGILTAIQKRLALPSTVDLATFGYAAPASAADAAGRGALRIAPGIFGRYALTFDQVGVVEDVRVVNTSLSSDVDSAIAVAARGVASDRIRGQTIILSLSTTPAPDTTTSVSLAHLQVPSWLQTRAVSLAIASGVVPGAVSTPADTALVEFIVDDAGHVVLPTVHRVDAPFDSLTVAAADSLSRAAYRPAMVGRCAVSQVVTRRFVFQR